MEEPTSQAAEAITEGMKSPLVNKDTIEMLRNLSHSAGDSFITTAIRLFRSAAQKHLQHVLNEAKGNEGEPIARAAHALKGAAANIGAGRLAAVAVVAVKCARENDISGAREAIAVLPRLYEDSYAALLEVFPKRYHPIDSPQGAEEDATMEGEEPSEADARTKERKEFPSPSTLAGALPGFHPETVSKLLAIETSSRPGFLKEAHETFLRAGEKQLTHLRDTLAKEDLEGAVSICRSFNGSAVAMGAVEISQQLRKLHEAAAQRHLQLARDLFQPLVQSFIQSTKAFQEFVKSRGSG